MTTTAVATSIDISQTLRANEKKNELATCLKELKLNDTLTKEQMVLVLGQWFHPLHYFPTFLSRLISVTPEIRTQTFVSRILWEELGKGDPQGAHEKIYIETITEGGFAVSDVAEAPPLPATERLVAGYKKASSELLSGLGFLYGTEVMDLQMVSSIGELMRRCTGKQDLAWVNVHVDQEPGHVESSENSVRPVLTVEDQKEVVRCAEEMWELWTDFFKAVQNEIASQN
jgi:pyrroloquinoline quinone (PQQ) biosynthesis protein C